MHKKPCTTNCFTAFGMHDLAKPREKDIKWDMIAHQYLDKHGLTA